MVIKKKKRLTKLDRLKHLFPTNKTLGLSRGYDKYGNRWKLIPVKKRKKR